MAHGFKYHHSESIINRWKYIDFGHKRLYIGKVARQIEKLMSTEKQVSTVITRCDYVAQVGTDELDVKKNQTLTLHDKIDDWLIVSSSVKKGKVIKY